MDRSFSERIQSYCEEHTSGPDNVLIELERETHLSSPTPQMLSGAYQGKLLEMLSRMIRPEAALEIGTFTGYSAICIARGLAPGGKLYAIEIDPEKEMIIRKYIGMAGMDDRIELMIGNAMELLPDITGRFQFIFIDAGKREYPQYFAKALQLLDDNGIMILDNTLWDGKVIESNRDTDAAIIDNLNKTIVATPGVNVVVLPIRDGITIVQKL